MGKGVSVRPETCGLADLIPLVLLVNGEWAPLLYVATQCWHRARSNQGDLTFSVPYKSCGVTVGVSNYIYIYFNVGEMFLYFVMWFKCDFRKIILIWI